MYLLLTFALCVHAGFKTSGGGSGDWLRLGRVDDDDKGLDLSNSLPKTSTQLAVDNKKDAPKVQGTHYLLVVTAIMETSVITTFSPRRLVGSLAQRKTKNES